MLKLKKRVDVGILLNSEMMILQINDTRRSSNTHGNDGQKKNGKTKYFDGLQNREFLKIKKRLKSYCHLIIEIMNDEARSNF